MKENEIQYVSNAGIILKDDKFKIGIDCLCRDSSGVYEDTPAHIRENLYVDFLMLLFIYLSLSFQFFGVAPQVPAILYIIPYYATKYQ